MSGFSGDGGPASAAEIDHPEGIAVDSSGDLFIADGFNNRVREVNLATGIITTVPGNGLTGFNGDGGPATAAELHFPTGISVDSSGHQFIADTGNYRVREVNLATGSITTVAGNGTAGFSGDGGPAGATEFSVPVDVGVDPSGDLAVDSSGDLFIADIGNDRIREMSKGAVVNVTANSSIPFVVNNAVYTIGSGVVSVAAADGLLQSNTGPTQLTVTAGTVTGAEGGTYVLSIDGSFTYTPPANFRGFDYAQYTAKDTVGDQATAMVNVLSQTGGVVWKFYEQVLKRDPDYGGLQFWINDLLNGGKTGDIAAGFFESDELLNKVLGNYYEQYLHRPLDADGLKYWKNVWHATGGPEQIQAGFADSLEFYASSGGTPDAWLTQIYLRILNRNPDPGGFQYWLNDYQQQQAAGVDAGTIRYDIALGFFDSAEAYGDDVTGWFQEYLFRAPTGAEQTQYVDQMESGAPDRTIEQEITNLPEYANNPPASPAGTAAPLPDYNLTTAQSQATVSAKDAFFSGL